MIARLFFASLLLCCWVCEQATAQYSFPVDTLRKAGRLNNRINVCVLPDGYTASEMSKFQTDATAFMNAMLNTTPFSQYRDYFNFFLVRVPSAQSGATHPGTAADEAGSGQPVETKDTYFGAQFDSYGIHRLVVPTQMTRITNVLATNLPDYDLVFMLVNSGYYGGSGGTTSVATVHASSGEIAVHEVGHTFTSLADEYWAGSQYARERDNMTQTASTTQVRWRNWLNTTNIGIYAHSSPGQNWYKPARSTCKMELLGRAFCSVCRESLSSKFFDLVNPIDAALPTPSSLTLTQPTTFSLTTIRSIPNTLRVEWRLDNQPLARLQDAVTIDPATLTFGQSYTLAAQVLDTTAFTRRDNHAAAHTRTQSWVIRRAGCPTPQSLRAGDWHDPTVWNCGSVPTSTDNVLVTHILTISNADAYARRVTFSANGAVLCRPNRHLRLLNQP
jgi:hypothetical protein